MRYVKSKLTICLARNPHVRGFTLIELVIVLLMAALLVAWSFPSLLQSIHNNQVASQNASLIAMLNFARSESIRRNASVTVTLGATPDGWEAIVEDPNNEADVEGCSLGQLRCASGAGVRLWQLSTEVVFNNRGYIRDSDDAWSAEVFYLQHDQCSGQNQRARIDITPTGQISSCRLPCDSTAVCPL